MFNLTNANQSRCEAIVTELPVLSATEQGRMASAGFVSGASWQGPGHWNKTSNGYFSVSLPCHINIF